MAIGMLIVDPELSLKFKVTVAIWGLPATVLHRSVHGGSVELVVLVVVVPDLRFKVTVKDPLLTVTAEVNGVEVVAPVGRVPTVMSEAG